jgi:hypothetical protein
MQRLRVPDDAHVPMNFKILFFGFCLGIVLARLGSVV